MVGTENLRVVLDWLRRVVSLCSVDLRCAARDFKDS